MSCARSIQNKTNGTSTVVPPLPTLSKVPEGIICKKSPKLNVTSSSSSSSTRTQLKISTPPNREELEDIVNGFSNIVKKSEKLLITPVKPTLLSTNIRRSGSLHLTKKDTEQRKPISDKTKTSTQSKPATVKPNESKFKLHESMSDRSNDCNTSSLSISRRPSVRPQQQTEKYCGIKCSLPSFTATVPQTFKGLEKHYTPTKPKLSTSTSTSVFMENQFTPTNTNGRDKSPWRLRFEKFLNHQELTPLSPTRDSIALNTTKSSLVGKENRTPSFRVPARRDRKSVV